MKVPFIEATQAIANSSLIVNFFSLIVFAEAVARIAGRLAMLRGRSEEQI